MTTFNHKRKMEEMESRERKFAKADELQRVIFNTDFK